MILVFLADSQASPTAFNGTTQSIVLKMLGFAKRIQFSDYVSERVTICFSLIHQSLHQEKVNDDAKDGITN